MARPTEIMNTQRTALRNGLPSHAEYVGVQASSIHDGHSMRAAVHSAGNVRSASAIEVNDSHARLLAVATAGKESHTAEINARLAAAVTNTPRTPAQLRLAAAVTEVRLELEKTLFKLEREMIELKRECERRMSEHNEKIRLARQRLIDHQILHGYPPAQPARLPANDDLTSEIEDPGVLVRAYVIRSCSHL